MLNTRKNMLSVNGTGERGFILILTMLVLLVLTALCLAGLDTSTFEVQIAANDRSSRVAFNLADGGSSLVGKLVENTLLDGAVPAYIPSTSFTGFTNPNDGTPTVNAWTDPADNVFLKRLLGTEAPLSDHTKYDFLIPNLSGSGEVYARINTPEVNYGGGGGSVEFASRAGGVAASAATYRGIELEVDAFAARNARSQLAVSFLFKN